MSFHPGSLASCIKRLLLIVLVLMSCESFSQGISNLWMSGYGSGNGNRYGGTNINFINGFPDTLMQNRIMDISDCNANISDSIGNLLFYTNGVFVANALGDTMLNGGGLNPSIYTTSAPYGLRIRQGNLILPLPSNQSLYYLFHETLFYDSLVHDYRSSEIYYSIIDMNLDGGLGGVIQKNVVLLSDTLTPGAITACKHGNGRDWWVVFHKSKGRRYYKYLLTPSGLQGPYMQDIGSSIAPNDWIWQSCFSPDGRKFASVMARDTFDVFDFDRCSGIFSNAFSVCLPDSQGARGTAISPNSQLLYISSTNYLYQYNLNSIPLDSGKIELTPFDGYGDIVRPFFTFYFLAQLANDGKIYINSGNTTRLMSVINNPNGIGRSCDLLQHGLVLPTVNAFSIPNFPNYFLGKDLGSVCDSLLMKKNEVNNSVNFTNADSNLIDTLITDERGEAIKPIDSILDKTMTYKEFITFSNQLIGSNKISKEK